MSSSQTEICNLAICHLGSAKRIANLETDVSGEASNCRIFFDIALEEMLREMSWPFATKIEALALIEEDPNTEWQYSYRYPSGCVNVRRVLSGIRRDTRQSRVPYRISFDDSARVIYTDQVEAYLEYTKLIDDPAYFPSDFTLALSYRIASLLAPVLTGGDPFKLGVQTFELYKMHLKKAAYNAFNEEQDEELPESEFIRTRE